VLVAGSQSSRQLPRRVRLARRDHDRGSPSHAEAKRSMATRRRRRRRLRALGPDRHARLAARYDQTGQIRMFYAHLSAATTSPEQDPSTIFLYVLAPATKACVSSVDDRFALLKDRRPSVQARKAAAIATWSCGDGQRTGRSFGRLSESPLGCDRTDHRCLRRGAWKAGNPGSPEGLPLP
jgi:hypothetical protein